MKFEFSKGEQAILCALLRNEIELRVLDIEVVSSRSVKPFDKKYIAHVKRDIATLEALLDKVKG